MVPARKMDAEAPFHQATFLGGVVPVLINILARITKDADRHSAKSTRTLVGGENRAPLHLVPNRSTAIKGGGKSK